MNAIRSEPTRSIFIFGATGSIGRNALDVCRRMGIRVVGAGVDRNITSLKDILQGLNVSVLHIGDESKSEVARDLFRTERLFFGKESIEEAIKESGADTVLNGVSGGAGLRYSVAAVKQSVPKLALANKESLVMAGQLLMKAAEESSTTILPVDSEHSSLFRLLRFVKREDVRRLILTASGGPFLEKERTEPSPEEVLAHPLWRMGRRITVDSATMFNKVFEVVEAHHLFGFAYERIDILVHPEGLVHGLVELGDGTLVAHISAADMRLPISYALAYPNTPSTSFPISLSDTAYRLLKPDSEKFTALRALQRLREGVSPSYVIALNAADEVAVNSFLEKRIPFSLIPEIVLDVADGIPEKEPSSIEDVYNIDEEARMMAEERVGR